MKLFSSEILGLVLILTTAAAFASQAPVANAGPDQTVSVGANCMATVTLNGSASTGDTLTYTWTGGFTGGTATGVTPTVTFTAGVFDVTLTVTDVNNVTATDTVTILAKDTTPPVISSVETGDLPAVLWPPNHKMRITLLLRQRPRTIATPRRSARLSR